MFQQKMLRLEPPGRRSGGGWTDAVKEDMKLDGLREKVVVWMETDVHVVSLQEDWTGLEWTGLDWADVMVPYLVQLLLRDLLSDRCVVLLEVQNKSQQATFSLVAHLLSQTSLHIRRLRHREKNDRVKQQQQQKQRETWTRWIQSRTSSELKAHQDL